MDPSARPVPRTAPPLGAVLVNEGKMTAAQAEQALELHRSGGMRFGEAALSLKLITERDLHSALAKQFDFAYLQTGPEGVSKELIAAYDPFGQRVEELRAIRTQLLIRWFNPEEGRSKLAIVSPGTGEGRSYFAANLAVIFSQLGLRTLLIDANMRTPRLHSIFRIPNRTGLSAVLAGRTDQDNVVPIPGIPMLSVLPAGSIPPNPQELLSRPAFAALLKGAQTNFDLTLVDTPAAMLYADVQSVTYRTGDALLLTRRDHTRISDAVRIVRELTDAGARVVGSVVNSI
ncbi:MAG: chain length determinant protein tyrosine kinase EpsG [Betaproteobacteria bacterium RIFCSPLOWO2_02_FULL_65_24]|nr:MAG: chain length determinant protein tyrosine kinase EpsG [Betaproteobacteria bacterium RIFCSPLOWO2_02_FULL_65_24]